MGRRNDFPARSLDDELGARFSERCFHLQHAHMRRIHGKEHVVVERDGSARRAVEDEAELAVQTFVFGHVDAISLPVARNAARRQGNERREATEQPIFGGPRGSAKSSTGIFSA
jgi:hypothetical protein